MAGKSESLNNGLSWQEKVDGGAFRALFRSMDRRSVAKAHSDHARLSLTPSASVGGWTKTRPGSLGLLPSGPDPVGERYVLRQPPVAYVDHEAARRKRRSPTAPLGPPCSRRPLLLFDHFVRDTRGGLVRGKQHLQRELGEGHVVRRAENRDRAEERHDSEAGGDP
jgi:hypothetical protein